MTYSEGEVDRRRRGIEAGQELSDGIGRPTVGAAEKRGYALSRVVLGEGMAEYAAGTVRVNVDETGNNGETTDIDPLSGTSAFQVTDGRNAIAHDAHVGDNRLRSRAVVNVASFQDDTEYGFILFGTIND
jgi:hypothetical protein